MLHNVCSNTIMAVHKAHITLPLLLLASALRATADQPSNSFIVSWSPQKTVLIKWKNCIKKRKNWAKLIRRIVQKIAENCAKVVGKFQLIHTNLVVTLSKNQQIQWHVYVAMFSHKAVIRPVYKLFVKYFTLSNSSLLNGQLSVQTVEHMLCRSCAMAKIVRLQKNVKMRSAR